MNEKIEKSLMKSEKIINYIYIQKHSNGSVSGKRNVSVTQDKKKIIISKDTFRQAPSGDGNGKRRP